jgi:hypothetical protein
LGNENEPSGGPGWACLWRAPTALGSGVVAGGEWIADVIGCRVQDGMTLREAGTGVPAASPYSVGIEGCGWGRMDRGCRGSGDGGWNENEPSGRPGRACLWRAPTALGSGVVVVRGCMRDFDTNGVGVPRRGTLPGLRSGLFPSKKQAPAGTRPLKKPDKKG